GRGLPRDRGLHRDLPRDHVLPLEVDAGRIDDRDAGIGRELEHALVEHDLLFVSLSEIELDGRNSGLYQPIERAGRAAERDVDARGDLRHELAIRILGGRADHHRYGEAAFVLVLLAVEEREQTDRSEERRVGKGGSARAGRGRWPEAGRNK